MASSVVSAALAEVKGEPPPSSPTSSEAPDWQRAFELLVSKCGTPQSSDMIDSSKKATEEELCELINKHAPFSSKDGPESDHMDVADYTEKMKLLKQCIDNGDVQLRSSVGQDFQREKAANSTLKRKYEAVGKNRDAQNTFGVKWAKLELSKKIQVMKSETEEVTDLSEINGFYRPFGKIVQLQGNDPPAFKAGIEIVKSCIADWQAGRLFRGFPYVKYNSRSKRLVFLDIEENVSAQHKKTIELRKTSKLNADSDPEALGDDSGEDGAAGSVPRQPAAKAKGKGKAKAKAKAAAAAAAAGAGKDDDDPNKRGDDRETARKKELTKAISNAMAAKKDAMLAMQTLSDILGLIASDSTWKWANNEHQLKRLRAGRDKIQDFKKGSEFWEQRFLLGNAFANHAKKTWDEHYIMTEAARTDELKKFTASVTKQNEAAHRIHQENLNADASDE